MAQYNFYIDVKLKDKVEKVLAESGIEGKPKFLEDMVNIYQIHLASKADMEIDMSVYQNTNQQSKETINKAFKHILTTLDYNFSTLQQDKIHIEKEKQVLINRKQEIEAEVEKVKLAAHEELKEVISKYELEKSTLIEEREKLSKENKSNLDLLNKSYKELESMSSIAKQTSSVMEENKKLRDEITKLQKSYQTDIVELQKKHLAEQEQTKKRLETKEIEFKQTQEQLQKDIDSKDKELFKVSHTLERCKEDLKKYQEEKKQQQIKLDNKSKELENITSKYNQLLGKIEILEKLEKEHHNDLGK